MSRRILSALSLLMLLTTAAGATELKVHSWPARFVPKDFAHISVVMDIGYWIDFINAQDTIKLQQVNLHTYEGCLDVKLVCNFDVSLRCVVTPTGAIRGRYSCFVEGGDINAPGGTARVCVRLEDANLATRLGGSKDIQVATVTVQITPRL